jgi:acyl-CoA dehydrogenase
VLLTGATGFVGGHLLAELLGRTCWTVICLVRSASPEVGLERVVRNLQAYGLPIDALPTRVRVCSGDLSRPRLGLEATEFESLAESCDAIYHDGALVNWIFPYEMMRDTNVLGTTEILRLAATTRRKPVHHISTLAIFNSRAFADREEILERYCPAGDDELHVGYSQTKWVAEQLVGRARAAGIPANVFRAGTIGGSSAGGPHNPHDFWTALLCGSIQVGAALHTEGLVDVAPVDYVCRAILHLSTHGPEAGATYHLSNPGPCTPESLLELLARKGFPVRPAPVAELAALATEARRAGRESPFARFLPLLEQPRETLHVLWNRHRHDCSRTLAGLADSGIACPPAGELVERYLEHFESIGVIAQRAPRRAARTGGGPRAVGLGSGSLSRLLTDDDHAFMAEVDAIAEAELAFLWDAGEVTDPAAMAAQLVETSSRLGRTGILRAVVPPVDGGVPSLVKTCILLERLGRAHPFAWRAGISAAFGGVITGAVGTSAQRAQYLPGFASGEKLMAIAVSEEGAGSDIGAMTTTAVREGDQYRISGGKTWIDNAGICDVYFVFARTTAELGAAGLSLFAVPGDHPGVTVRPLDMMAPFPVGSITFDEVVVPEAARLGAEGDGLRILMETFRFTRPLVAAAATGFAIRGLEEAARRAQERRTMGVRLVSHQAIQFQLAEMITDLDASRMLLYRAACMHDDQEPGLERAACVAKLDATERAQVILDKAVQIHGALGVKVGSVVERLYRENRMLKMVDGTSEMMKLTIAHELGPYASSSR